MYYHNNLKNIYDLFEDLFEKYSGVKQKVIEFKVKRNILPEYHLLAGITKNNQILYDTSSDYYYKIKSTDISVSILGNKFRTD